MSTARKSIAQRAAESRDALASARAAAVAAEAAHEAAVQAVATMRQGQRAGLTDATPLDLATARAQVDLSSDNIERARGEVARAERGLVNDETHLAEAVEAALTKILSGFVVKTTTEAHKAPDTVTVPEVFLVQRQASKSDPISGRISGNVDLYLVRPVWAKPLETDDLTESLNRSSVRADVTSLGSRKVGNDLREDHHRIAVRLAWPTTVLPTISRVGYGASFWPQGFAGGYADQMQRGTMYVTRSSEYSGKGYSVQAAGEHTAVTEKIDDNGVRHTTVTATLIAASDDPDMSLPRMAQGLTEYAAAQVGVYADNLGRVESIRLTTADPGSTRVRGRKMSGRVTHTVTIEAVFASLTTA